MKGLHMIKTWLLNSKNITPFHLRYVLLQLLNVNGAELQYRTQTLGMHTCTVLKESSLALLILNLLHLFGRIGSHFSRRLEPCTYKGANVSGMSRGGKMCNNVCFTMIL